MKRNINTSGFEKALNRIKGSAKCRDHVVDKEHHKWIPTCEIESKLAIEYPSLTTPWLEHEHIHGVNSVVTGVCEKHQMLIPMNLGNLWRGTTKYGCPECAWEAGETNDIYKRYRNAPGYIGRSGMEFKIFCEIKKVWPDAVPGHRIDGRKEIDIWIPSVGCGVEYNGNYYHQESVGRGKEYHLGKSRTAWQQEKFILHVFEEEAEDVDRIIRILKIFEAAMSQLKSNMITVPGGLSAQVVSTGLAESFHNKWDFIAEPFVRHCDFHFGMFDKNFNMVAAFSGIRKYGLIVKTSIAVPFLALKEVFQWAKKGYGLPPLVAKVDMRNPTTQLTYRCAEGVALAFVTEPQPIPMDEKYRMLPVSQGNALVASEYLRKPYPGEFARAWDCGSFWNCLKNDRPKWGPSA